MGIVISLRWHINENKKRTPVHVPTSVRKARRRQNDDGATFFSLLRLFPNAKTQNRFKEVSSQSSESEAF